MRTGVLPCPVNIGQVFKGEILCCNCFVLAGGALYDVHINIPYLSGALIMFLTAAVLWLKLARFGSPSPSPGN
ncbi:hypothetical protein [Desulfofundulus thermocisternus]|uniref:hypothetical protein n=1 Tax=Desulfofundulus thermocisternus TaxID=42471 RepID=UPI0019DCEC1F|nr:hypothetical protein [Desulfofundulus thermocisternus]MBE3584999.1 hypothetical protein [Thermoanaerobacter sp.]MCS5694594.1 hypothetical protein [Desulfofundulus thermocisternus]